MRTKTGTFLIWLLVALPVAYLAYRYPGLSETVPIHYGLDGAADGWGPKLTLWLLPGITAFTAILLGWIIPLADRSTNVQMMGKKYDRLAVGLVGVIAFLSCYFTYRAGAEHLGNTNIILSIIGFLIAFSGNYLQTIRPNYFMGIRTPWTIASERVWTRTHRMAGYLWLVGGSVLFVLGFVLPGRYTAHVLVASVVIFALIPTWYSWRLSRQRN